MKRVFSALFCIVLLTGLLAGCSGQASTSEASSIPEETLNVELDGGEVPLGEASQPEDEPESTPDEGTEDPDGEETPAPDKDLDEIYEALAEAAGLAATLDVTMLDLNAGGGITTDNIVELSAGQSKIGGDSGLVIVLYVKNGTVDDMVTELEGYRDSLVGGPDYEEFADAKTATENARIAAYGNYVVYVGVSAEAGASYDTVDEALATLFG